MDSLSIASRVKRLEASIVDGLILFGAMLPVTFLTGGFDMVSKGGKPTMLYSLSMGILAIAAFFALNGKKLVESGQTIGKKIFAIKVVDLNGDLPNFKKHLIKRYAVYFLPNLFPVWILGDLFGLINFLTIFGKSRRCLHDRIAGTIVVNC